MTDSDFQRGPLTTEQIAGVNTSSAQARPGLTDDANDAPGAVADNPPSSDPAATLAGHGNADADSDGTEAALVGESERSAQLLDRAEVDDMTAQWKEIQTRFVDEPQQAVRDADALVANVMQRLAQMFASERAQLEAQWAGGGDPSTEDLRLGLQRYRSFFERLLTV